MNLQAAGVIDASGRFVAPGFIDVHSHAGDGSGPRAGFRHDNPARRSAPPGLPEHHHRRRQAGSRGDRDQGRAYAIERGAISLEHGMRSSTSLPAPIMELKDRGQLREGFAADIVIFDLATIRDSLNLPTIHKFFHN